MKKFKDWLSLLACASLLAACGGGGGNPGAITNGNTTPPPPVSKVASVVLVSNADTIVSSGDDGTEVTLTVLVKDATNNVLAGETVDLKADSGTLTSASKVTDAGGIVTAKLSVKGDSSLRTITVTATAGTLSSTKKITVVPIMSPASVVLVASADTIVSSGADGSEVTLTAVVKDASNNVLPGQNVDFTADSGNIAVASKVSDATGVVTARLSVKGDSSLRTITVTAAVGKVVSAPKQIAVVAVLPPAVPTVALTLLNNAGTASNSLSSAAPLTARVLVKNKDGKPVANALVAFTADNALVAMSPSAGTTLTDESGVASVVLRPASLSASGAGKVSASVVVAGTTLTSEANFNVGATTITLGTVSLSPASITAYGSSVVSVDLLAGGGKYTEQQMNVAFTSACVTAGKATLAATAPTSNGTAQVVFRDQGCGNNDVISASVNGVAKASTATLVIARPTAASIQFVTATPIDKSIVIKGQGGIGRTETAVLTFRVFDTFGKPLAGQTVRFTTTSKDVTINKVSDSTDANGDVITTVNSGTKPTTFRIIATLDNKASTTSDSIVVTTGLPVAQAFSLTVVSPNVEGWQYDSGPTVAATNVNVLLADQAGNPVPDGVPVVFQTNLGSVGSSSKGACNTVNGGCSVDYRSQAPRTATPNFPATPCNTGGGLGVITNDSTRTGLATICASTTDGRNTLFSKITIFLSGSFANKVYWADGPTPSTQLTGVPTDLGTISSTDSKVFLLQINDINGNPMPSGTKVEISNIVNATAVGVSPATVQNVFAHTAIGDASSGTGIDDNSILQGSYHSVSIGSAQAKPCLTALAATFNVAVTTPKGNVTSYPFKLAFTCP
ncbi:MAG: Ig-like domain-containing protein [Pseudomonadota bacterium]